MRIAYPNFMLLLLAILCNLPSYLEGGTLSLSVIYSREPINTIEGEYLTLTCTVKFQTKNCKDIEGRWCLSTQDICTPLMDPHRYLIQVNETEDKEYRLRSIFVKFNTLTLQDSGIYQCNAKCDSGTAAKGHFVHVNVTGPKLSKWSGQHSVEPALLILSIILLLCSF